MDWKPFIIQAFNYDRWANKQWISRIGGFKNFDRPYAILEHILSSQETWLKRCGAEIYPQTTDMSLVELFDLTTQGWIAVVEGSSFDDPIAYTTSIGNSYVQPLGHIALHVINHGTYHRGQLRGLAEADGYTNFPETDLILYLREDGLK